MKAEGRVDRIANWILKSKARTVILIVLVILISQGCAIAWRVWMYGWKVGLFDFFLFRTPH